MASSSVIREIKVFGNVVPIGSHNQQKWQHQGMGSNLLKEAERISREEFGMERILVISGIGVREYFRNRGYSQLGPYMARKI